MGKSDSLKNGMRSGLDGLLSSTGKSTQKKEPAPVKAEKEPSRCIAILLSTRVFIPG